MGSDNGKNAYELAATKRTVKTKPKQDSKAVKGSIDYMKAAKLHYRQGKSLKESLEAVGVSPKQAARGRNYMARHSHRFAEAFGKEAKNALLEAQVLGQSLSDGEIKQIVRGRLAQLSAVGEKDAKGAVQATTQLGKLTGVESFAQDQSGGVQIFGMVIPPEWESRFAVTGDSVETIQGKMEQRGKYLVTGEPMIHSPLVSGEVAEPAPATPKTLEEQIEEIKAAAGPEKK